MSGIVMVWSNPLLKTSPLNRIDPLASDRPDQAKVLLLAVRCPPAPTWMSELPQVLVWVKLAPVALRVPLMVRPKLGLPVSTARILVPAVMLTVAPALTVNSPVAALNTYRWLAV